MTIKPIRRDWNLSTWEREAPRLGVGRIAPKRRAELVAALEGAPDDQVVKISARELRLLLDMGERDRERGVRMEGTGDNEGVIYLATLDPEVPRHLRTIEIIATGPAPDPRVFRVPVRLVEDMTRYVLATQDSMAAQDDTDPSNVLFMQSGVAADGQPNHNDLFDLVRQGVRAKGIAELYGRSEGRIYQLIREARRERPDLAWPPTTRGPRPKTTDGKGPTGKPTKGTTK